MTPDKVRVYVDEMLQEEARGELSLVTEAKYALRPGTLCMSLGALFQAVQGRPDADRVMLAFLQAAPTNGSAFIDWDQRSWETRRSAPYWALACGYKRTFRHLCVDCGLRFEDNELIDPAPNNVMAQLARADWDFQLFFFQEIWAPGYCPCGRTRLLNVNEHADSSGGTALHFVALQGGEHMRERMQLFVAMGVDPNKTDHDSKSAETYAQRVEEGYQRVQLPRMSPWG